MSASEDGTNLIAMAAGVVLAAIALYLLLTRRTRLGQQMPLPLHPARPRPGAVPRMARGVRSSVR